MSIAPSSFESAASRQVGAAPPMKREVRVNRESERSIRQSPLESPRRKTPYAMPRTGRRRTAKRRTTMAMDVRGTRIRGSRS